MKLYEELADWWPIFAPPEVFEEQAAAYAEVLKKACDAKVVLELGCGGGSVAYHLKKHFAMDLVDLSPRMLQAAGQLNPECRVFVGDMRTVRLERKYDAVFINDAVLYMTTESDLRMAMATAFLSLKPGGSALFVPGSTRETFLERTEQGGGEDEMRSGRYIAWMHDPNPSDTQYEVDFAILLNEGDGSAMRCIHDHHVFGLFPRDCWMEWLKLEGFAPEWIAGDKEMFLGRRPVSPEL